MRAAIRHAGPIRLTLPEELTAAAHVYLDAAHGTRLAVSSDRTSRGGDNSLDDVRERLTAAYGEGRISVERRPLHTAIGRGQVLIATLRRPPEAGVIALWLGTSAPDRLRLSFRSSAFGELTDVFDAALNSLSRDAHPQPASTGYTRHRYDSLHFELPSRLSAPTAFRFAHPSRSLRVLVELVGEVSDLGAVPQTRFIALCDPQEALDIEGHERRERASGAREYRWSVTRRSSTPMRESAYSLRASHVVQGEAVARVFAWAESDDEDILERAWGELLTAEEAWRDP